MDKLTLNAEKRKLTGRKVKHLRKEGKLPANIYGKKTKSTSIQINEKEFEEVFKKAGETSLVEISLEKGKKPVLIHNVQTSPLTDKTIHVDFLQVDLKEKVTAQVPVELVGESPAEKQGLGTVVQYIDEIEVEALPTDLPEKFDVDVTGLKQADDAVFIKELNIKDKRKVDIKEDAEGIIVKVEEVKEEVEEVAPAEEVSEGAEAEETKDTKVEAKEPTEEKEEEEQEKEKEEKKND